MKKLVKASCAADCTLLEQLPNIGPALAADLRLMGIHEPQQLRCRDAFVLFQQLCTATGQRHDPCVLDTFMAAVDFMGGAAAAPWWWYTAQRKLLCEKAPTSLALLPSGLQARWPSPATRERAGAHSVQPRSPEGAPTLQPGDPSAVVA